MFDSPMEHCAVCGQMVTLDQTGTECRRKHQCTGDVVCPLRSYFIGIDGGFDPQQETISPTGCPGGPRSSGADY